MAEVYAADRSYASYDANNTRISEPQRTLPARPRATLHYHPNMKYAELLENRDDVGATRKKPSLALGNSPANSVFLGRTRDLDSVDEELLTKLCYLFELDKLYDLPDLGKGGEILGKF